MEEVPEFKMTIDENKEVSIKRRKSIMMALAEEVKTQQDVLEENPVL
jgi:hypothetical protein